MNPSKLLPIVTIARIALAGDGSDPRRAFDAVPGTAHPAIAADLAWLDMGLASARLSAHPGAEGVVSAPHFQVGYGWRTDEIRDVFRSDSVVDRLDRRELSLATAMALSQLGLDAFGRGRFDASLGFAFVREDAVSKETELEAGRQDVDVSIAARMGAWRGAAALCGAIEVSGDSGAARDEKVELRLGRIAGDGFAWGAGLDIPVSDDGHAGVRLGVSREFRDAIGFHGQLSTSYSRQPDPATGADELVRNSLELHLGTRIRFRPWGSDEGDTWMRGIVDPRIGTAPDGFLLRGWEIGVSATWDLVGGEARPAVELSRRF